MRHKNSLASLVGTLLLFSMLFVVGCGKVDTEEEPTSVASLAATAPSEVADAPRTTTTPMNTWPAPAHVPTETPTPTATPTATPTLTRMPTPLPVDAPTLTPTPVSSGSANPTVRRVIFILDNSESVVKKCFTYAQEPANSEARRAMGDMVFFLVDLLGELGRAANARADTPAVTLEVGVYTLHSDDSPRELLAMQDVATLRAGWDEPMVAMLNGRSIDRGGWDLSWLDGAEDGAVIPMALGPNDENAVILLTDGYSGETPTPAPGATAVNESTLLSQFEQQMVGLPGNFVFNVVLFNCPDLLLAIDASTWHELVEPRANGRSGLLAILDLPRSASPHYDATAPWRTFAPVTQGLLAQLNIPALCPPVAQVGDYQPAGYGWLLPAGFAESAAAPCAPVAGDAPLMRLPSRDAPARLPGDTASFVLRLVAASARPGGYSVFFRRGDETFRYALNDANAGHVYAIDLEDHVLRNVLAAEGELCRDIEWWVEGPEQASFAWWETQPARYSIDIEREDVAITNNEAIEVNYRVYEVLGEPGNADCYDLRVKLNTATGGELLQTIPLRTIYPELRGSVIFENYPFIPAAHESLSVNADLVENLNRTPGEGMEPPGPPAQRVIAATAAAEVVENVYVPVFDDDNVHTAGCKPDGDQCSIEVTFDFANSDYFTGDTVPPVAQVYALNALSQEKLSNDTELFKPGESCDGLIPNLGLPGVQENTRAKHPAETVVASGLDLLDGSAIHYSDADNPQREFSFSFFTPVQESTCQYVGYLIQWENHALWPAVLCTRDESDNVTCYETVLRYP